MRNHSPSTTLLPPEILVRTGGGLSNPLPTSHTAGMAMFFKLRQFLVSLAAVFVLSCNAPGKGVA